MVQVWLSHCSLKFPFLLAGFESTETPFLVVQSLMSRQIMPSLVSVVNLFICTLHFSWGNLVILLLCLILEKANIKFAASNSKENDNQVLLCLFAKKVERKIALISLQKQISTTDRLFHFSAFPLSDIQTTNGT